MFLKLLGIKKAPQKYGAFKYCKAIYFLETFDEFDYIFDFNAYKQEDILDLPKGYPEFNYYLISSQWVSNYLNCHNVERYTEVELNYIIGKRSLEIAALDRFGPKTRIIRLPVVVGSGDHHHRLDFLVGRILKRDRILVPNSNQLIDIEWVDDIVQTIYLSLTFSNISFFALR